MILVVGGRVVFLIAYLGFFQIMVVDTPGLAASSLIEEEATIDRIVKVLKDDVEYVNTFAIVIKNTETRQTRDLVGTISNYRRIFGEDFIKNVILVTTFWFYGKEDAIHLPEGKRTKTQKAKKKKTQP